MAARDFSSTGKVFVLSNTACQFGFLCGPVLGNMVNELFGFAAVCNATGGMLVLTGGVLLAHVLFCESGR